MQPESSTYHVLTSWARLGLTTQWSSRQRGLCVVRGDLGLQWNATIPRSTGVKYSRQGIISMICESYGLWRKWRLPDCIQTVNRWSIPSTRLLWHWIRTCRWSSTSTFTVPFASGERTLYSVVVLSISYPPGNQERAAKVPMGWGGLQGLNDKGGVLNDQHSKMKRKFPYHENSILWTRQLPIISPRWHRPR